MARYLYSELASLIQAIKNGHSAPSNSDRLRDLIDDHLPSGSGFDNGTKLDFDASHADKLVFHTAFHHMIEGTYSGWTEHTVTVTPSFSNQMHIRISGRNKDGIKEYIGDTFHDALRKQDYSS